MERQVNTPKKDLKLEVCVDSIASGLAAAEGGASCIELCSALSEGGLTPTIGVLRILKAEINIPIHCMLRPRRGTDFIYTELEMAAIKHDMELLRANGADGFVFGALTAAHEIDVEKCRLVVESALDTPVTFHRAFDLTKPELMHDNLEILKRLGFKRLLTSGFRQTATEGSEFIAQLVAKHHRDIVVMPGAGISVANLEELLTATKCTMFHSSAQTSADDVPICEGNETRMECDVSMGKQDFEPYSTMTDANVVRKMVTIAKAIGSV